MRRILTFSLTLLAAGLCLAGNDDPVVMHINGKPVTRAEFEYSYNKNNADGVIDKKSVDEYVPLFIDYKLKVEAAEDARLDTLPSFKREFASYRDQQIRSAFVDSTDIEAMAHNIYTEAQQRIDGNGGMVKVAHILVLLPQNSDEGMKKVTKAKADSIYKVLEKGKDFAAVAQECSQDPGSAANGGELPWIIKGQVVKAFQDKAWAMKDGEISEPVETPYGWHIIKKIGARNFFDYDSQRKSILRFIDARGGREQIINSKLDTLAKQQNTTIGQILKDKEKELEAKDPNLKYLIQEYHDGLLFYEIANRTVWDKARKDSAGQDAWFEKNRARYTWNEPRFKGIAYYARKKEDIQNVKDSLKGIPFNEWEDVLVKKFNNDSILRLQVEKGIFTEGMNALVDKMVFGKDTTAAPVKDYPFSGVYGKKLTEPEETDDVREQVISDYQDELEKRWVEALRKRYKVSIDNKVLATVNKH